jgi:hypothetical protein
MESELPSVNLLFMFFHRRLLKHDILIISKKMLSRGILYLFGRPAKSKGSGSSSFPRKFYQGTKILSENNIK